VFGKKVTYVNTSRGRLAEDVKMDWPDSGQCFVAGFHSDGNEISYSWSALNSWVRILNKALYQVVRKFRTCRGGN